METKVNKYERKALLEMLLNIATGIEAKLREEAARDVSCPICRDYHIVNVKYVLSIKDDKSERFYFREKESLTRCYCSGAAACEKINRNLESLAVVLDKTNMFKCGRCNKVITILDEKKVLTLKGKHDREMELVCSECYGSKAFQKQHDKLLNEYLEICGEIKRVSEESRPAIKKISAEELLKRMMNNKTSGVNP